ncbi:MULTISPECIES: flagellar assembly protein FliH [Salinicola]|uniref:Flagellar assembly protein FliH n=1 Tax=Salinicola socius TaxID=404433 RepID=A0A1Q8SVW7_9GAMM|nr:MULTISPECIES: flagellar assembly protein FliH [Salinicola]OLO05571.1 hypothetical protein BTW07_03615 [Salinicola socius]
MATSDRHPHATPGPGDEWHRWQMEDLGRGPASEKPGPNGDAEHRRRQHDAEEKARRTIAEKAQRQGMESGYREGHEQGYQAGYREGLAAADAAAELEFHKRLELTLVPLAELAEHFRQAMTTLDTEIADQLVELALIAGRQLAGESLAANPEHILSVVHELLDADTTLNGKPRLWLHPDDLELVTGSMGERLMASGWECQPDTSLERGGCRVTSAGGGLDASLSTQWKAILDQRRQRKMMPSASPESQETHESGPDNAARAGSRSADAGPDSADDGNPSDE